MLKNSNKKWFTHFPGIPLKIYTKYISYNCSCQLFSIYGSLLQKYLHYFPFLFIKEIKYFAISIGQIHYADSSLT